MNNYIQIYKNVIEPKYCKQLIEKFEKSISEHDKQDSFPMSFTQINLNESKWDEEVNYLSSVYLRYLEQYKIDCNISEYMWPKEYAFEQIRMKRYLPNSNDEFGNHVDAIDLKSSKRFLVFFIYLDDNDEGHTTFTKLGQASPCVRGSLLMFPPFWPWPHAGLKPVDKPKYILGSYLHYHN